MNIRNNVVLVGAAEDPHVAAVRETLLETGHEPIVFDARAFPEKMRISMGAPLNEVSINGATGGLPAAVYNRSLYQDPAGFGVDVADEMQNDWRRTMMAFRERNTILSSLLLRWESLGVPIYNPPSARNNITKPYQIAVLEAAGLPVPRTLWSNDPDEARSFCRSQPAIYKPVAGGASTRKVTDKDLTDERLQALGTAPVCFQELLPGDDVRVYVIDGKVEVALRIVTDAIDFRQNEQHIEMIELEPLVVEHCVRAASVLGLRWTGMDLKGTADGCFKILELNPSAMFLGFDSRSGSDIRACLSRALRAHIK